MPGMTTIYDWMNANPDLAEKITRAREAGGDKIAEDCLAIADERAEDMVDVQKQRLRVDTRLRLLAKWYPKRYGDKIEVTGQIGLNITSPLAQLRKLREERASFHASILDAEVVPDVTAHDCI